MNVPVADSEPSFERDQVLTSHEAGALIQVNPSSINKWIKEGRLPCFRTPGGHRRIRAADLAAFLDAHKMPIPPSLVFALKRRILVVDDDPKQLEGLKRLFRPHHDRVEVLAITNGIDALIKVGSFKPHAVLLDVYMPEVDGLEVCRRLKSAPDTKSIEVILTTGQSSASLQRKATEAGARAVLSKPIEVAGILDILGIPRRRELARS